MNVTPVQCQTAIQRIIRAGRVPYIKGNPGICKSQLVDQFAKEHRLKVIAFHLAAADPTDLQGFPSAQAMRMSYLPPEDFPIVGDKIPDGYDGWMLFFDELSQAFPSIQNASYKIFLDKKVGQKDLHKNVVMAAAGNLETDKANTHRMSTALQSRLIHLTLEVSNMDWQRWAVTADIDYRIRAFLKWKPKLLHNFKPDHNDDTFACPRTWEFASDEIKHSPNEIDVIDLAILIGTIGKGPAIEFQGYSLIYDKLPSFEDILKNPHKIDIPEEPSVRHALASLISHPDNLIHLPEAMPFIDRLPVEFQVWSLRDAIKKKPELLNHPALEIWKDKYGDRLY